jgi:hypothetical protein
MGTEVLAEKLFSDVSGIKCGIVRPIDSEKKYIYKGTTSSVFVEGPRRVGRSALLRRLSHLCHSKQFEGRHNLHSTFRTVTPPSRCCQLVTVKSSLSSVLFVTQRCSVAFRLSL